MGSCLSQTFLTPPFQGHAGKSGAAHTEHVRLASMGTPLHNYTSLRQLWRSMLGLSERRRKFLVSRVLLSAAKPARQAPRTVI